MSLYLVEKLPFYLFVCLFVCLHDYVVDVGITLQLTGNIMTTLDFLVSHFLFLKILKSLKSLKVSGIIGERVEKLKA